MGLDLDHLWMVASAANRDQQDRPWEWSGGYPQTITRIGDAVLIAKTFESPDFPSTIAEFIATFDPPTVLSLLRELSNPAPPGDEPGPPSRGRNDP